MDEFYQRIQDGEEMTIIDVRPAEKYQAGHVPGAVNLPYESLASRLDELDAEKNYYLICQRGNTSQKAYRLLDEAGYLPINVEGGTSQYPAELEE